MMERAVRMRRTRSWSARLASAALVGAALLVTATPTIGADDATAREMVVALGTVDVAFDPLHAYTAIEAQLFTALSEGLVSYHPETLDPVPGVARSWQVSEDGLRYRFLLRDNARFSDGTQVIAEDFRASWLRIINPGEQAEYSVLFDVIKGVADYRSGANNDDEAVGIRAISPIELEVVLERPAEHFLSTLAHHAFAPVYPAYRAQVGWERQAPIIGNGPFSLTGREADELVFDRSPHYWARSEVELDRIRVRAFENPAAANAGFLAGEIHWADSFDGSDATAAQIRPFLVTNRLFGTTYFVFKSSDPPFDDARVRRALVLMVPWDTVRNPERVPFPTSGLVPRTANYPAVEGIPAPDMRTARRLLEQAGFADGAGLPPVTVTVAGSWAASLAADLETAWESNLGIDVTVAVVREYDDYLAEVKAGNFTLTISSWIGDFIDPISFLQMWTSSSNLNDAGYSSRDYDRMIDRAIGSKGLDRMQLLAEAEELLLQDAVVLPVHHLVTQSLIDLQRVSGWTPNLLGIHPFRYLGFRRADLPAGVAAVADFFPG